MRHLGSPGRARCVGLGLISALLLSLLPAVGASAVGVNLSFSTSPPNPASAGSPFPLTVHVRDNGGAALAGVLVTVDIDPAHNPGGSTLTCASGSADSSNASGDAQFAGCRIDRPGSGYQLRARASGATTVNSTGFDVQVGPPASLAFGSYPANPTFADFAPQPTVQILDAGGNVVTTAMRTITLTINKHTGTFGCNGGTSKAAVNGIVQFFGCRQLTIDSGYRLTANDGPGGLAPTTGAMFTVRAAAASRLLVCWGASLPCNTNPPSNVMGGTPFSAAPVVRVADAAGNTVTADDNTVIALSIAPGSPLSGGPGTLSCSGGLTKRVNNGVAQFNGCSINRTGTGYRLQATSTPALPAVQSNPLNVAVGPPLKLVFIGQPPATATAATPFVSPVQVAIADAGGNVVTSGIAATVRLAFATNPGGSALTCSGGTDVATVNGVATFNGCAVSNGGTGYRLSAHTIATSPPRTIASATSAQFNVQAAGTTILLTPTPASGVIVWGDTVLLSVHFTVSGAPRPFTLQVSHDKITWSTIASLQTNVNGDATFPYRPSDNRYYRAVFAGASDLAASTSAVLRVVVRQINILRPTNGVHVRKVGLGTTVTFTSTVRPARPELPQAHANFVVYRLVGGTWTLIDNRVLGVNAAGVASMPVAFSSRGSYYVRSQAVPTTLNANSGWSPVERYDVT